MAGGRGNIYNLNSPHNSVQIAAGAAATGAVEITLPVAIVAMAYIIGQGLADAGKDGLIDEYAIDLPWGSQSRYTMLRPAPGNRRRHQPRAELLRLPGC